MVIPLHILDWKPHLHQVVNGNMKSFFLHLYSIFVYLCIELSDRIQTILQWLKGKNVQHERHKHITPNKQKRNGPIHMTTKPVKLYIIWIIVGFDKMYLLYKLPIVPGMEIQ